MDLPLPPLLPEVHPASNEDDSDLQMFQDLNSKYGSIEETRKPQVISHIDKSIQKVVHEKNLDIGLNLDVTPEIRSGKDSHGEKTNDSSCSTMDTAKDATGKREFPARPNAQESASSGINRKEEELSHGRITSKDDRR